MTQIEKHAAFAALHVPGDPLILFNIWDAGSAKAVAEAGAKAIATGSASVAAANGFDDAEGLPIGMALANAALVVQAVELPVTIDRTKLVSKSKNTPYHGWTFKGGVAATLVGGKVAYSNPRVGTGLQ